MLNLDKTKLEQALQQMMDREKQTDTRVKELNDLYVSVFGQKEEAEIELRTLQSRLLNLRDARLIAIGINEDAAAARALVVECYRVSTKSDSIKRREKAEEQMGEYITVLERQCAHPFVVGYDGWQEYDYDNTFNPGERKCIVCGFKEYSPGRTQGRFPSDSKDIYKKLNPGPARVVFSVQSKEYRALNIWQPLEKVLQDVVPARFLQIINEAIAESPV